MSGVGASPWRREGGGGGCEEAQGRRCGAEACAGGARAGRGSARGGFPHLKVRGLVERSQGGAGRRRGAARAFFTSCLESATTPVVHIPIALVILNICVTHVGSTSLSGTFFCVTTTTESAPRTAMDVSPAAFTALKAYSTW